MKKRICVSLYGIAFAVFMGGCTTSIYRVSLPPDAVAQLKASTVSGVVAVEKDEIGTLTNAPNVTAAINVGLGGGLFFAIGGSITNSIAAKRAEAAATGIRDGLLEYAHDKALAVAFSQRFASAGDVAPALSAVVVSKNTTVTEISRLAQEADGDAVVLVFVRHFMSRDFSHVVLFAEALVWAKSEALLKSVAKMDNAYQDEPALYRNKIHISWPIPAENRPKKSNRKTNAAVWEQDNAVRLRTALDAAAVELAEAVYWDLGEPAHKNYKKVPGIIGPIATKDFTTPAGADDKHGYLYRREGDRLWLRTGDGCVYVQSK